MRSPCPSQHGYILLSDQGCIATLAADYFLVGSYLLDKLQVNRICFDQDVWGRLNNVLSVMGFAEMLFCYL